MPVLSHQATLEKGWQRLASWFTADGYQPALVAVALWELSRDQIIATLAPRDSYIVAASERSIAIEEVRKMMNAVVTTTPFGKRLVVIAGCERLTLPAAQALLKFLEEPTKGNRILLVTKFPKRLPPTIRSRVQIVELQRPGAEKTPGVSLSTPGVEETPAKLDPVQLLTSKNRRGLTDGELRGITELLEQHVRRGAHKGDIYRAMLRLRDYYKIRSAGGNEKLAADVLLASVLELEQERR